MLGDHLAEVQAVSRAGERVRLLPVGREEVELDCALASGDLRNLRVFFFEGSRLAALYDLHSCSGCCDMMLGTFVWVEAGA